MDFDPIQKRLMPHERILWKGTPIQGVMFTGQDLFLVPFSLLWAGFAIFWLYNAVQGNTPLMFGIFGLVFVCIGLFMAVGRFIFDAWLRRRTFYAVADMRVLICRMAPMASLLSLDLNFLPQVEVVDETDTRGSLRFGPQAPFNRSAGFSTWVPSLNPTPHFLKIEGAGKVFDTIAKAAAEKRRISSEKMA